MTVLKQALEFCISPVGLLTFLLAGGLVLTPFRKRAKAARRMVLAGSCLFAVILLTPLADIWVASLERPYPALQKIDASAGIRTVVVLSGYGEDRPSLPVTSKLWPDTLQRVVEGIRLYRLAPGAKLVMSGGVLRTGDRPIARQMADFAVALGVPPADVATEETSQTTYENLREVQKIIGQGPFVLVTSAADLRRATAVARKLGMKPLPAPAAIWAAQHFPPGLSWRDFGWEALGSVGPSTARFSYIQRAWHEYLGYAWYWLLGRV